jgi:hypothetical protein
MKAAFEKMTGMPDAWTNPALMVSRNAFIQGWEAALAAQPVQEPDNGDELTIAYMSGVHRGKELAAQPAQEPDYDALSQKQLASLKRDTRISLEDAAVRATHKVMAELGEEHMTTRKTLEQMAQEAIRERIILTSAGYIADEDDDIQVYQRPWVGLTDEDQFNLVHAMNKNDWHAIQMMDAIEAKLKEKNT